MPVPSQGLVAAPSHWTPREFQVAIFRAGVYSAPEFDWDKGREDDYSF